MLANFDRKKRKHQNGITLLEMLFVIAIMALIAGLVMGSPLILKKSEKTAEHSRTEFLAWYRYISTQALYLSSPMRICLTSKGAIVQEYSAGKGWADTLKRYIVPSDITMSSTFPCGKILNSGNDDFATEVLFNYAG